MKMTCIMHPMTMNQSEAVRSQSVNQSGAVQSLSASHPQTSWKWFGCFPHFTYVDGLTSETGLYSHD